VRFTNKGFMARLMIFGTRCEPLSRQFVTGILSWAFMQGRAEKK
jgi:hypothetical protein